MSDLTLYDMRMRMNDIFNPRNIINRFGNAWLIPRADGRHELVGGSANDFTAAKEWVSLFAQDYFKSASGTAPEIQILLW
jgi:hypothetical protein